MNARSLRFLGRCLSSGKTTNSYRFSLAFKARTSRAAHQSHLCSKTNQHLLHLKNDSISCYLCAESAHSRLSFRAQALNGLSCWVHDTSQSFPCTCYTAHKARSIKLVQRTRLSTLFRTDHVPLVIIHRNAHVSFCIVRIVT